MTSPSTDPAAAPRGAAPRFRVLLPLDRSSLSEAALPWADCLAGALGASVELIHVLPRDLQSESAEAAVVFSQRLTSSASAAPVVGSHSSPEIEEARGMLERAGRSLTKSAAPTLVVLEGEADAQIGAHARAHEDAATLVVMSTHARSGLGRVVLGSVASSVIRSAGVPVLALHPDTPGPRDVPRRLLVPLDDSDLAASVVPAVLPFARMLGWTLRLVSVVPLPVPGIPVQGGVIPVAPVPTPEPDKMAARLEEVAAEIRRAGVPVETTLVFGDRVEAISGEATSADCGLIAMSTHGRSGIGRLALGSLTESLIRTAPVPIIAVHPGGSPADALPTAIL